LVRSNRLINNYQVFQSGQRSTNRLTFEGVNKSISGVNNANEYIPTNQ